MDNQNNIKYSQAEKHKIKEMLRDAILVLCQNTVAHQMHISVQALIGITVDDGDDVLLVSIQELIDKQHEAYATEDMQLLEAGNDTGGTYNAWGGDNNMNNMVEVDEATVELYENETEYGENTERCGNIEEEELASLMTFASTTQDAVFHSQMAVKQESVRCKSKRGRPPKSSAAQTSPSYKLTGCQQPKQTGSISAYGKISKRSHPSLQRAQVRHAGIRGSRQKSHTGISGACRKISDIPNRLGRDGGWQQTSSDEPAADSTVEHLTIYTCNRCGAKLQCMGSLKRHQQAHDASIVYRCNGCDKVFTRNDSLIRHRRLCPAVIQMEQEMQEESQNYRNT